MKRNAILVVLVTALALVWIGCSNPAKEAQKMFDGGQYEELVAKFGADPNLASVVQMAKDKIAEKLVAEGKYAMVLEMYATSPAAKEAKMKLAEAAFMAGNYQEVMVKYADTPWAMQAKMKLDSIANAGKPGQPGVQQPGKPGTPPQSGAKAELEKKAQEALDKVLAVKMKNMKVKALEEYTKNAEFAGTSAMAKAQDELKKLK
ncbi:hypothetical protein HZB60_11145 [candidate division KSB1 bacterium]|nr:hypothetical protein [candidate division KSB1 bacterium]